MVARSTSGFFRAPAENAQNQGKEYECINVGGEQFHAVAVALIDYLQNNSPINDAVLKKVLGRFYQYFPQHAVNDAYLTPKERMGRLLSNSRKSELVESMAYVLRQLTVDKLYEDHLNLVYRDVFAKVPKDTAKSYLRDMKTVMPPVALKALEDSLNIAITLSFKEPDHELRRRDGVVDNDQPALRLQVQGDKYYPEVKRKADFTFVGQLAISTKPMLMPNEQEGKMNDIITAISAENRELLHAYEQQRNAFLSMVAAGELSSTQLRDLYISFLPEQEYNAGFITRLEQDAHPIIATAPVSSEKRMVQLLTNALASWVIVGAVDKEELFDRIENTPVNASVKAH
ncbi:hypothetical protein [Legionella rowbothamii]|uniref:hypothetical protein n=1 Tax=Legionella rowbothamii TaxID=96229 RepID=UPI001A94C7F9|nr:hypothetical protein [Legionella rowbothamii]